MYTPGAHLPDSHFTFTYGTDAYRLVYVGGIIQMRGMEVWGVAECICGCGRNMYRLSGGQTLAHSRASSVEWQERPEPTAEDRALAALFEGC